MNPVFWQAFPPRYAKTQYNLQNAKEYFEEQLCVDEYYDEWQRVAGLWFGLGAERLGFSGRIFSKSSRKLPFKGMQRSLPFFGDAGMQ